jgi:hypothetical protein
VITIDKNLFKQIDECDDPIKLEKIKIKVLYVISQYLAEISSKKLIYK